MHILLAEDDRRLGALIVHMLKKKFYTVDWVLNGHDAYNQAAAFEYELLILDWMMPEKDGITVCRSLRQEGYQGAILILTARDAIDDRVFGLDAGADDYLTKPFEFEELFARMRAIARRGQSPLQQNIMKAANLALDFNKRQIYRDNQEIYLTPREFQLLELLMRNYGQVVSREIILDRIWGYDAEVSNNTLDAFIKLLRKKVENPGKYKLIHNVRGVGYKLEG